MFENNAIAIATYKKHIKFKRAAIKYAKEQNRKGCYDELIKHQKQGIALLERLIKELS